MKRTLILLSLLAILRSEIFPQGVAAPLTFQGLDRTAIAGARAAAMGGSTIANDGDAAMLFSNPAGLAGLAGIEARIGGSFQKNSCSMDQQWLPSDLYDELTILFENKELFKTRTFDVIPPNWSKQTQRLDGLLAAVAVPVTIGGIQIAGAVGIAQSANLDYYFQNNNALDPNVGQLRPQPVPRLKQNQVDSVQWFQSIVQRKGSINGVTAGVGAAPIAGLRFGAKITMHKGSSDDAASRLERGRLRLGTKPNSTNLNILSLDSVYFNRTQTGTSDYSGTSVSFGAQYEGSNLAVGATVQLPWSLERKWSSTVLSANSTGVRSDAVAGTETYKFPLVVEYGVSFRLTKRLSVSLQYLYRNYAAVEQTIARNAVTQMPDPPVISYASIPETGPSADTVIHPWIGGGALRAGVEFTAAKWLAIRGGYREDVQGFAPEGAALMNEPARGSVYSAGCGVSYGIFFADVSYEYARLKYFDAWLSNVNYITQEYHRVLLETGVRF